MINIIFDKDECCHMMVWKDWDARDVTIMWLAQLFHGFFVLPTKNHHRQHWRPNHVCFTTSCVNQLCKLFLSKVGYVVFLKSETCSLYNCSYYVWQKLDTPFFCCSLLRILSRAHEKLRVPHSEKWEYDLPCNLKCFNFPDLQPSIWSSSESWNPVP